MYTHMYTAAAEGGCTEGMFNVGMCYRDGVCMPVNEKEAVSGDITVKHICLCMSVSKSNNIHVRGCMCVFA
jgi:hypothetical protein